MNFLRIAICFFMMLSVGLVNAQDQFDRLFSADTTDFVGVRIIDDEGEGFYLLSVIDTINLVSDSLDTATSSFIGTALNVSRISAKGDRVEWTKNYKADDTVRFDPAMIDLRLLESGSLGFSATCLDDNGNVRTKVGSINAETQELNWSMNIGSENSLRNGLSRAELLPLPDSNFMVAHQMTMDTGETSLAISKLSDDGELFWTRFYAMDNPQMLLPVFSAEMVLMKDNNIGVAGDFMENSTYVMLIDPNGSVIWSNTYSTDGGHEFQGLEMVGDSSLILSMLATDNQFTDNAFLRLNYFGEIDTAVYRNQANIGLFPSELVANDSDDIFICGRYETGLLSSNETGYYVEKVDNQWNTIWAHSFRDTANIQDFVGKSDLDILPNNGIVSVFPYVKQGDERFTIYPRIAKLDENGLTGCEEELTLNPYEVLEVMRDTLSFDIRDATFADTVDMTQRNFNYDVLVLSLDTETYCAKDTNNIMFLLDATTEGAVSYEWKSAETGDDVIGVDSVFTATKVNVQYSVEVKIEGEFCYILCANTTLTVFPPPAPRLAFDFSDYCTDPVNKPINLVVSDISDGDVIVWSTGEQDVTQITVFDLGTYEVTVTDDCMETRTASINITEADLPQPTIAIRLDNNQADKCSGFLTLFVDNPQDYTDLEWSNGETGASITVTADDGPGAYSVSGVDDCLRDVSDSFEIGAANFYTEGVINSIEVTCLDENNASVVLDYSGDISDNDVIWSPSGLAGPTQVFEGNGTATVSVQDQCGVVLNDEVAFRCAGCNERTTTNNSDTELGCLCYPNAFISGGATNIENEANFRFGPENRCGNVTEYELVVINRWGKTVFSTDRVDEAWNGRVDNGSKNAPAEVYYFYSKYTVDGVEFTHKGDVTLIR